MDKYHEVQDEILRYDDVVIWTFVITAVEEWSHLLYLKRRTEVLWEKTVSQNNKEVFKDDSLTSMGTSALLESGALYCFFNTMSLTNTAVKVILMEMYENIILTKRSDIFRIK